MNTKHAIRVAAVGVFAAAIIGASATTAFAAEPVPTVGSTGPYYLVDNGSGSPIAAGTSNAWEADLAASPVADNSDFSHAFTAPAGATSVETFIAPRGSELTPSAWSAWGIGSIDNGGSLMPNANLSTQIAGNAAGVKTNGGNYSLGIAFLKNNGLTVVDGGAFYTYITVTPGTGAWLFDTPSTVTPPTPPSGSFDQNITATTVPVPNGTLNLVAPANPNTTLATSIVNGLSTSTGNIGKFSVQDGRVVTPKGWTVTTSVTDFTNSADSSVKIDKKQLGIAPQAAAGTTLPTGVSLASAQQAGSAINPAPFADAAVGTAIAQTDLDAGLTFIAPGDKPVGTYTGKLTITLASK